MLNIKNMPSFLSGITPKIMGIINLSEHSFCPIGRHQSIDEAVSYALALEQQGADIIDVGAEATNPKIPIVADIDTELNFLIPFIQKLREKSTIPVSVDTSQPAVMAAVIEAGANIINDVRALRVEGALEMVARLQVPVCLMHMAHPFGIPAPQEKCAFPTDIVQVVKAFFDARIHACLAAGITKENIILDPGIGAGLFGKTSQDCIALIKATSTLVALGYPLLMGVSFKSFIGDLLGLPVEERSIPSLTTAIYAALQGVRILRVHEVDKTKQAIKMLSYFE